MILRSWARSTVGVPHTCARRRVGGARRGAARCCGPRAALRAAWAGADLALELAPREQRKHERRDHGAETLFERRNLRLHLCVGVACRASAGAGAGCTRRRSAAAGRAPRGGRASRGGRAWRGACEAGGAELVQKGNALVERHRGIRCLRARPVQRRDAP